MLRLLLEYARYIPIYQMSDELLYSYQRAQNVSTLDKFCLSAKDWQQQDQQQLLKNTKITDVCNSRHILEIEGKPVTTIMPARSETPATAGTPSTAVTSTTAMMPCSNNSDTRGSREARSRSWVLWRRFTKKSKLSKTHSPYAQCKLKLIPRILSIS